MRIKSYAKGLFHLFFPDLCYSCDTNEPLEGGHFCLPCLRNLPFINSVEDSRSALIGKDVFPAEADYYRALFYYSKDSLVADMIHQIKYQGQYRTARYLGQELGKRMINDLSWENSVLIPVPIHKKRWRERGFNQAEETAIGIAQVLKIPVWNDLLIRNQYARSQTGKDKTSRLEVLESSFELNVNFDQPAPFIILVDDVVTTGSTVAACTRLLAKCNPGSIGVVSIGISI